MARRYLVRWLGALTFVSLLSPALAESTNRTATASGAAVSPATAEPVAGSLAAKTRELWRRQMELERANPEVTALRKQIADHERQLIELRQRLAAQLAEMPEIKDLERQRIELVRQMQQSGGAAAGPAVEASRGADSK